MAEWKKIITSGSTAELGGISSSLAIVPTTDNGADIGSAGLEWKDLYIDGVAYLDSAQIGQLTSALDANTQAITNVDINSGNIDGTTIGAAAAAAGTFTDIVGTSLDLGDNNIANVGDIDADSLSVADSSVGLNIAFGGVTTKNKITLTDNLADALNITDGSNSYIKFTTTDSSEEIVVSKDTQFLGDVSGSSVSTGSFGQLELSGGTFTSASLAAAIANDGDITGVDIDGQTGGITIASETNTTSGNYSATIQLPTALTVPSSIKHDSLVIGRSDADDLITFSSGDISLGIGGTEVLGVDSTGVVVTGNLTVNGTTTTVNTTNTNVADRFLLLNSGSATGDGGIVVQGNANSSGSAFAYDVSADRWGFQSGSVGANAVGVVPESYTAEVVTSDVASRRKNGNIKVESSEIWIYVE